MDNPPAKFTAIEAGGLSVAVESGWHIASLRYFDRAGSFAGAVREAIGLPLPEPLRAVEAKSASGDGRFILAWRSPTETLLLSKSRAAYTELERRLAADLEGCMVAQTGGVSLIRVQGARAGELLHGLAAATAIPDVGAALNGRFAEVHVLAACIQSGEFLLLVERVYARHLLDWMAVTAADFAAPKLV
jgi:heterotetrameric sarcosine oxidase gamma subunit